MRKGAIVLVPFPFTDLSGHKVRPALVLFASARGEDCIVAFISSRSAKKKSQYEVLVHMLSENGLKVDSVVKVDKIATLQKRIVIGEIGSVEKSVQKETEGTLRRLFGL